MINWIKRLLGRKSLKLIYIPVSYQTDTHSTEGAHYQYPSELAGADYGRHVRWESEKTKDCPNLCLCQPRKCAKKPKAFHPLDFEID